jgi:hypothetical protein
MKVFELKDFDRGYFIGDFPKAIFRTNAFEVSLKFHKKGDKHERHYHRFTTEFILVVRGKLHVNGTYISQGQIFVLEPYMVNEIEYLEDSELVIVKSPSLPNDREVIEWN